MKFNEGEKFEFTEEQKQYIIDNWGKESPHSMKKKFGCTWYAVAKVAEKNNLELPTSNEWTDEEIQTLIDLSKEFHYTEIAKKMGKTENAIYLKARRLGIPLIQERRKWTQEEEQEFADLWGAITIEQIAKKLNRSIFSLKVKAVRMGLGPMIRNNYELITVSDMEEFLNVSRDRIMNTWTKMGLNLKKKKVSNNRTYYTITWQSLMNFLESHQNEWDSRNVEVNMLGPEPDWLKEKRKRDKEENPLWYRKWTDEEIQTAITFIENGKTYKEIANQLNRSEWAVTRILYGMGYTFMLPKY